MFLTRVCLAACAAMATLMLALAPGAQAAGWSPEAMAIPQTAQGNLFALSCPQRNRCEGVGDTTDPNGNVRALAESWSGSAWTVQSASNIDAPISSMNAVSCSSADSCEAIGSYAGPNSAGAFAEHWDGTAWTIDPINNPAGGYISFNGISCTAVTACTAVGYEIDIKTGAQLPFVERLTNLGWRPEKTPTPQGAQGAALNSVSCTGFSACTAVGNYFTSNGSTFPYGQSRTGATWTLEAMPASSSDVLLSAPSTVSCSSADACTAVGLTFTFQSAYPLIERWNGFAWTQQSVPGLSRYPLSQLSGVSCPSARSCFAVGGVASQTSSTPLAVQWNGSTWQIHSTPSEPGGYLGAVSCASLTSCEALGTPGLAQSSAMWHPSTRLPRPGLLAFAPALPRAGAQSSGRSAEMLASPPSGSVSSTSPRSRFDAPATTARLGQHPAVAATSLTLAEHWNGTRWYLNLTPAFTGAAFSQGEGVGCASSTTCFATGFWLDNVSGAELPLLEQRTGARWRQVPVALPSGAVGGVLFDVTCSASTSCVAVGEAFTPTSEEAYTAQWNGKGWTVQGLPGPNGLGSALGSVSCTSPKACTAVGALLNNSDGDQTTLAEFWNGKTWTAQSTPNAIGNRSSDLYGVSCPAAGDCTAIGNDNSNTTGVMYALAEHWNGSGWRLVAFPAPPEPGFSIPNPVACWAAKGCLAVGFYATQTTGGPFADGWDGIKWTPQTLPSSLFGLNGVGCATATACVATGNGQSAIWNGTAWSTVPLAQPVVGYYPALDGVSCSDGACLSVGSAVTGEPIPVAELYS